MWGRTSELTLLKSLLIKETSSLVVVKGRRRIGKSTLIQHFGKIYGKCFYEFSGIAPHSKQTNQDQLNQFTFQYNQQFKKKEAPFDDWNKAFNSLAIQVKKKSRTVILFDEISWMGGFDPNFSGKLKIAWDTQFKINSKLVLVLCGSVSTWIQENILNSTNFVGRVSKDITLTELPLEVVSKFWRSWDSKVSDFEKLRFLAVTGCIPKYLEELSPESSSDENIRLLCFTSSGFLYDEFNKIFADIFGRQTKTYRKLVTLLSDENLSASAIAKKLKLELSSTLIKYLHNLELSGFVSRDFRYEIGSKKSRISTYRLKDNYLRFALKYILDSKLRTKSIESNSISMDMLPNWDSILGLQIENLVYNHLPEIIKAMNLPLEQIISASPYFQKKTAHNYGACQIDLLIQTQEKSAYICEIKFRRRLTSKIINEVEKKINRLNKRRGWSYRPVLIYEGEIDPNENYKFRTYFSKIISLGSLLRERSNFGVP